MTSLTTGEEVRRFPRSGDSMLALPQGIRHPSEVFVRIAEMSGLPIQDSRDLVGDQVETWSETCGDLVGDLR